MFNIILKLNNHTWKKLQNIFVLEKNKAQISGFVVVAKKNSKSFKTVCRSFFWINGSQDI